MSNIHECKLTDARGRTRVGESNETQWGEGVTHDAPGSGPLCTSGWIHFYRHPLIAVVMNPIHGNYDLSTALLWEISREGAYKDDLGLKSGSQIVTTVRRIPIPTVSTNQRRRIAILCAMQVYDEPKWVAWAEAWLNGTDRSGTSANAVAAAYAATNAVAAAYDAIYAATNAATSAAAAADAAADAVANAVAAKCALGGFDIVAIIQRAIAEEPDGGEA